MKDDSALRRREFLGAVGGISTVTVGATGIYRSNRNAEARFTWSPQNPLEGEEVRFDGEESIGVGGIAEYEWDFTSDGTVDAFGYWSDHSYEDPGEYEVTLSVTDSEGNTDQKTKSIKVWNDPKTTDTPSSKTPNTPTPTPTELNNPPVANFTISPKSPVVGQSITFDASLSEDPDGNIKSYEWDFTDDGLLDEKGKVVTNSYNQAGTYSIKLQVTDLQGRIAKTWKTIVVRESTTPTPTRSPSPTPTPTSSPSATPTETPTLIPTQSPSPTPIPTPTRKPLNPLKNTSLLSMIGYVVAIAGGLGYLIRRS